VVDLDHHRRMAVFAGIRHDVPSGVHQGRIACQPQRRARKAQDLAPASPRRRKISKRSDAEGGYISAAKRDLGYLALD
jgi:hypothetical protein